jgi:magnesium chelatase subunit I
MNITTQEAWVERDGHRRLEVPNYIREIIEEIAFLARDDKRVDRRSGVSQRLPISCLESVVSNAEQRAVRNREAVALARVADVYEAIPAITGKLELDYEGEMRGADQVARDVIRAAVGKVFSRYFGEVNFQQVVQWFEMGGELRLPESGTIEETFAQLRKIQGLVEAVDRAGLANKKDPAITTAAAEFALEGLWAHKRISRDEERGFFAEPRKAPEAREQYGRPPRRQFN